MDEGGAADIRLLNRPWSPRPCDLIVWEASSTAAVPSAATFIVVFFFMFAGSILFNWSLNGG